MQIFEDGKNVFSIIPIIYNFLLRNALERLKNVQN